MAKNKQKKLNSISDIHNSWIDWNNATNDIHEKLGRTSNIVGEFAEQLVREYFEKLNDGCTYKLATASKEGYDIEKNGDIKEKIQVKTRRITANTGKNLSDIHSWEFDTLIIVLFEKDGSIKSVRSIPKDKIKIQEKYNVNNEQCDAKKRKNGTAWVISLSDNFLDKTTDLTGDFKNKYPKLFN